MDFQAARLAMVESQIRPNAVRDPLILNAFATLPEKRSSRRIRKRLPTWTEPFR